MHRIGTDRRHECAENKRRTSSYPARRPQAEVSCNRPPWQNHRGRQQEGESSRGGRREADEQTGGHRDPGTRRTGHERDGLSAADHESRREFPMDSIPPSLRSRSLREQQEKPESDRGDGDHERVAQRLRKARVDGETCRMPRATVASTTSHPRRACPPAGRRRRSHVAQHRREMPGGNRSAPRRANRRGPRHRRQAPDRASRSALVPG